MSLTMDAIRAWVGDFEIGKGRPYAEGAAVLGCLRRGDTLRACVRGTRMRPYRVEVSAINGEIRSAQCNCPVGSETPDAARCKHVAAVLLAYLEAPNRFVDRDSAMPDLVDRDRSDLIAVVRELIRRAPELEPLLAVRLPGAHAPTDSPPDFHFWQAAELIRSVNLANDWAAREIAEGLTDLYRMATEFRRSPGQAQGARAVVAGLTQAMANELSPEQRRQVLEALPDEVRTGLTVAAASSPPPKAEAPF